MKVGDLVHYIEGWPRHVAGQEGLIIDGPKHDFLDRHIDGQQWEVFWMYCNKIGWWDEFRLEVFDENR